ESDPKGDDSVGNFSWLVAWVSWFCREIGPILVALNATLSLAKKICRLVKGRKSGLGRDRE
ncbi:MAG TPA: hypothetical protein VNU93_01070, partial [Verrucomicrobiae bacterium]|nr:hypothetical protein [Verrucomicrobiae bacterium]